MRKRKESHESTPVVDTNILFVPSSAEDPNALGVEGLMGMIDEAGAAISPTQPPEPPEVPLSEARTEVMDAVVIPASSAQPIVMPPSFPPTLLTPPTPSSSSPLHTIPAHASSIQPVTAQPPCAFPAPNRRFLPPPIRWPPS